MPRGKKKIVESSVAVLDTPVASQDGVATNETVSSNGDVPQDSIIQTEETSGGQLEYQEVAPNVWVAFDLNDRKGLIHIAVSRDVVGKRARAGTSDTIATTGGPRWIGIGTPTQRKYDPRSILLFLNVGVPHPGYVPGERKQAAKKATTRNTTKATTRKGGRKKTRLPVKQQRTPRRRIQPTDTVSQDT